MSANPIEMPGENPSEYPSESDIETRNEAEANDVIRSSREEWMKLAREIALNQVA